MSPDREPLLTAQQVAVELGVCRKFLTRHAAEMGACRVGTRLKFTRAGLDAYLERRRVTQPKPEPAPAPKRHLSVVGRGSTNPVSKRAWEAV